MRKGLIFACPVAMVLAAAAEDALSEQSSSEESLDVGSRLELFVDDFLIENMNGLELALQQPRSAGKVMTFDRRQRPISGRPTSTSGFRSGFFLAGRTTVRRRQPERRMPCS
jgi:hypothetical protein